MCIFGQIVVLFFLIYFQTKGYSLRRIFFLDAFVFQLVGVEQGLPQLVCETKFVSHCYDWKIPVDGSVATLWIQDQHSFWVEDDA